MPLALHDHTYAVAVGDDLVILDLAADAYHCVPEGALRLRLQPDGRSLAPKDPAEAAPLIEAALASHVAGAPPSRHIQDLPSASLPAGLSAGLTFREMLRLIACLADVVTGYWRRPFAAILSSAARSGLRGRGSRAEAFRLAALFAQALPWLPLPGKCLVRSFVLLRFLRRSGCGADWIFGVSTWPFAAHCWLQFGEVALDDHADRLTIYRPIMAVRG